MSYASKKGYRAEHHAELWVAEHIGVNVYRPRAGRPEDIGDLCGLPLVLSIKDHAKLELSAWVHGLRAMVDASGLTTGFVLHKRRGYGDVGEWYLTTTPRLALPIIRSYVEQRGLTR
jgi:hypothetical protein